MPSEWFEVPRKFVGLAQVLADCNYLQDVRQVLDYMEKPWKWSDEFGIWKKHGYPVDDTDEGWAAFYSELDEYALS